MKKIALAALGCVLALGIGFGSVADAKEWKKVRIATEGAYPPFNFVDADGKLAGFEIDLANALCAEMKVECTLVKQDWDGMIPALKARKYDLIMASMSITDERKQQVDFSDWYYRMPARFVAKKGAGLTVTPEGLKGKTIGVQRETVSDKFLTDNYGSSVTIKRYATQDEVYLDLTAGRLDAYVADIIVSRDAFLSKPEGKDYEFTGLEFSDPKWFGDGIGAAMRKQDNDLTALFNKALKALIANGTYQKVAAKYPDFDSYLRK